MITTIFIFLGIILFAIPAVGLFVGFRQVHHEDKSQSIWRKENNDAHILRGHGGRGY
jgi:hypothetical protein